jgi:hypothetical protein
LLLGRTQKGQPTLLLGLRTAQYHIKTSDLGHPRKGYAKVFGIEPYFDRPYYVGFNLAGFELGLVPDDGAANASEGSAAVYWGVTNMQTAFEHLIASGAKKQSDIQDVGDGIKEATVLDPFDNPFGIIENPHFGK